MKYLPSSCLVAQLVPAYGVQFAYLTGGQGSIPALVWRNKRSLDPKFRSTTGDPPVTAVGICIPQRQVRPNFGH